MIDFNFPFPFFGIDKGHNPNEQPQITSPSMSNMRPFDASDGRARGGQRPGLDKKYAQQIGSDSNAILAICQVTVIED